MSPDRIAELRRQRALVAQHLAWIDSELIAAGSGKAQSQAGASAAATATEASGSEATDEVPPLPASALSATTAPHDDPAIALANARADEIIEKYRATEALDPATTKRGCLVLFGAIFVLCGAALLAVYYFGYVQK